MKFRSFVAVVAAFSFVSGSALSAEPILIKFSHVVAQDTPKGKGAEKFKVLAEQYTNGAVKVEIYPNSTLFKDKEEMEALQLGAVQIIAPALSKFGPLGVKTFEVFDLPYIFDGYDDLHKVTTGPVGQKLFESLKPKGIRGLAYWDNGFKVFSANRPLHEVADYKGLKMRIQPSKVLDAQMRALKSLPQVMAFSEVYQALQTGVVDGTENPPSNLYTKKMHEVQSDVSLTYHGYLGYAVITNDKFWSSLPEEVRGQLEKAMTDATQYANDIARQKNEESLAAVEASGKSKIYQPTKAQLQAMKKALLPAHRKMASRIGQEVIDEVYQATGFTAK